MPVDQKDNEMRPDRQLTIATPFSARWYCLDDWLAALDAQTVNKHLCKLLWLDNSGDEAFGKRLAEEAEKRREEWAEVRVIVDGSRISAETETPKGKDPQVAYCWQMLRREIGTPWTLCLESDILIPPRCVEQLLWSPVNQPDVVGVSAAVPYHHMKEPYVGVMAWDITGGEQQPVSPLPTPGLPVMSAPRYRVAYHLPRPLWGSTPINAVGFACLLLRTDAFQETPLVADLTTGLGFDQLFCVRLRERGLLWIVWELECIHYQTMPSGDHRKVTIPAVADVDVVIPCWGEYEAWLDEALESVFRQDCQQAIATITVATVAGDAATLKRVTPYSAEDARVRVIEIESAPSSTATVSRARNAGAAQGKATYLQFLDADDVLPATYLRSQLALLEANPRAACAIAAVLGFEENGAWTPAPTADPHFIVGRPFFQVPHIASTMRRTVFEELGGFDETALDELWDLWTRAYENGRFPMANVNCPPYMMRGHHPSEISKLNWTECREQIITRYPRAYRRPDLDCWVVMHNRNPLKSGGDSLHLDRVRAGLWTNGIAADLREQVEDVSYYHAVHLFHIDEPWSVEFARNASAQHRPLITHAIYRGERRYALGEVAHYSSRIICCSEGEGQAILRDLPQLADRAVVVPLGVDAAFLEPAIDPLPDLPENYVLIVGRFEERKNQLALLTALSGTDIPVVMIGGPDPETGGWAYRDACVASGYPRLTVLDAVPHADLPAYYQRAKVVASTALIESAGLTLLEGQAAGNVAGTNLVVSTGNLSWRDWEGMASFCDPANASSIREAVEREFRRPRSIKPAPWTWAQVGNRIAAITRMVAGR